MVSLGNGRLRKGIQEAKKSRSQEADADCSKSLNRHRQRSQIPRSILHLLTLDF
jgi:hypothetical protein